MMMAWWLFKFTVFIYINACLSVCELKNISTKKYGTASSIQKFCPKLNSKTQRIKEVQILGGKLPKAVNHSYKEPKDKGNGLQWKDPRLEVQMFLLQ